MGRIADLLEHPSHLSSYMPHSLGHHRKSSIGGIVMLALLVLGVAWMWPEIQRYIKIKRM
jgi:hypothetical protein